MTSSRVRFPRVGLVVRIGLVLISAVVIYGVPSVVTATWLGVIVQGLIISLSTLALTVLAGYGGQFSIASAGFLAVGAGTLVELTTKLHAPTLVGIVVATAAGAFIGLIVGLPALRLRGLYLLLSTLAAHFILLYFFAEYAAHSFGAYGLTYEPLKLFGTKFITDKKWYYLLAVIVVCVMLFVNNLRKTGVGRSLFAIKQNEVAAAASGIDVARLKLATFVGSSALIAFAGAIYGLYFQALSSDFFTLQMAINLYVALVVGGQFAAGGAVIGSMFVAAGPTVVATVAKEFHSDWLNSHAGETTNFIFGAAIILIMVLQPAGVWGWIQGLSRFIRRQLEGGDDAPEAPSPVRVAEGVPS